MNAPSPPAHILAIDDEECVRHYYRDLLARAGYRVQTAAHGEEALRCLEDQSFDLLLLDLCMPQMDGKAFLRRLRRQQHRPDVMVVSGRATLEDAVEMAKLGAYRVIEKTVSPEELMATMEQFLDLRRDPLIAYIRANFATIPSREEVARHFQVCPETVSNRIMSYTGQSFHDFLESCRVQETQRLLATTGLEVKQIFPRVGFGSCKTLERALQRLTGQTPSQYRQEIRAQG